MSFHKPGLNCDLGEIDPTLQLEKSIMPLIHRCNIACGGHAGDIETIHGCISLAKENGVLVGAHPSYPDIENFGRISIKMSKDELARTIKLQINKVSNICKEFNYELSYVKAHGALYHDVAFDEILSLTFVNCVKELGILEIMGPLNSPLEIACKRSGLGYVKEAFADRRYNAEGKLVSRKISGSVLNDLEDVITQCNSLINQVALKTIDDKDILISCDSICVHSDTENSIQILQAINKTFF